MTPATRDTSLIAPLPEKRRGPKARGIRCGDKKLTAWQWFMVTGVPKTP
jgi:hypothetical protein